MVSGNNKHRSVLGMILLSLLAVCGYMGTAQEPVRAVSVSVSRTLYEMEELEADTLESARVRLNQERENELQLLKSVADNEGSDGVLRQEALDQIAQIAGRMEIEAQVQACLIEMGFEKALPVSGAQGMTVICSSGSMEEETDRLRIIDTVCSVSGYEARDIKIILTKN